MRGPRCDSAAPFRSALRRRGDSRVVLAADRDRRGGQPLQGGDRPAAGDVARHVVRLIDSTPEDNPNLDFVIDDAARTVLRLRDEGRRLFLHCVAGQSRTPAVAARVAVLAGVPLGEALRSVVHALPGARPQRFLVEALERLSEGDWRVPPGALGCRGDLHARPGRRRPGPGGLTVARLESEAP
jgi:hypothetical protein